MTASFLPPLRARIAGAVILSGMASPMCPDLWSGRFYSTAYDASFFMQVRIRFEMLHKADRRPPFGFHEGVVDGITFLDDEAAGAIEPGRAVQRDRSWQKTRQVVLLACDPAAAGHVDAHPIAVGRRHHVLEDGVARTEGGQHMLLRHPSAADNDRLSRQIDHRRVFERVELRADLHVARRDERGTAVMADGYFVARHVMDSGGDVATDARSRRVR